MTLQPAPALFLDRDGVVNEEVHYLYRIADLRFVEGIFSLCRTAQSLGYRLVIVTNQAGIGRGMFTTEDFEILMDHIRAEFRERGIHLDAVYHCPYHPEHGIGEFRRESPDRKPSPGMLLRAASDFNLDLPNSIMIGDRCSDIEAANAAGLRQAFFIAGTETTPCNSPHMAIQTLAEVEAWLQSDSAAQPMP